MGFYFEWSKVIKTIKNYLINPFVKPKKVCIFAPAYAPIAIGASAGKPASIERIDF